MLTRNELEEFQSRGFVRLSRAIEESEVRVMEQRIWSFLSERFGHHRDDPKTWRITHPSGLQPLKLEPLFKAIGSAKTRAALDALMGPEGWKEPKNWGQFLVSFPNASQDWTIPTGPWHTDFGYLAPPDRILGVLLFSFLSDVPARTGGTLVIAGSHRLIARFVADRPARAFQKMKTFRRSFTNSHPWLQALTRDDPAEDRPARFLGRDELIDGVSVSVTELIGSAGDAILCHPWLMHAASLNTGQSPRFMCAQRIHLNPQGLGERPPS